MACVRERQSAVRRELSAETGDEPTAARTIKILIEPGQQSSGGKPLSGQSPKRPDGERPGHGCFQSLTADVAENEERRAVNLGKDLVEISSDLGGRDISGIEAATGQRRGDSGTSWRCISRAADNSANTRACSRLREVKRTNMTAPMASRKIALAISLGKSGAVPHSRIGRERKSRFQPSSAPN